MGFAFHPINLRLLTSDNLTATNASAAKNIVGTAFGMADPARSVAEDLILQSLGKEDVGSFNQHLSDRYIDRIDLENATANNLLRAHFRGIV